MFYRRKVLLALIEEFGEKIGRTELQKLLFLVSKLQKSPSYDFVPYNFGCYSFQANADLKTLVNKGYIEECENTWKLKLNGKISTELRKNDLAHIKSVIRTNKGKSTKELVKEIYIKHPYYAINSQILSDLLTETEKTAILNEKITGTEKILYTIGYEGISIEKYLNNLLKNDVKLLCDVRRNPISRKFGFSKRQLQYTTSALGINYIHMPELGIDSNKRKSLSTHKDYMSLFEEYEKSTLNNQSLALSKIISFINKDKRIALTCFEASHHMCHRGRIVKHLKEHKDWNFKLKHL